MNKSAYISTIGPSFLLSNYGSFFQHLCLRRFLAKQGYGAARWKSYDRALSETDWLKLRLRHWFYRLYWTFRLPQGFEELRDGLLDTDRMIAKFRKSYKKMIGPLNEPNDVRPGDLCVLGSDQVLGWKSEVWFSEVKGCTKIVYAGSADWKKCAVDEEWQSDVRRIFPDFNGVGIREQAGVDLINSLAAPNVKAVQVVDPVLLTTSEEFCGLASPKKVFKRPTLFCYLVNIRAREQLQLSTLEELAKRLGCDLRIVGIQGAMGYIPKKYRLVLGPQEFLAAVRDAKYVITNSFHGSCFAIHFKKQFLSITQIDEPGRDQNARQRELMSWTGLSAWYCDLVSVEKAAAQIVESIDYAAAATVLATRRCASEKWYNTLGVC